MLYMPIFFLKGFMINEYFEFVLFSNLAKDFKLPMLHLKITSFELGEIIMGN